MADETSLYRGQGSVPVPDPTQRTTENLFREIASLKEVVFTRLDAMDRAMIVFSEGLTRTPTETDKAISQLKELILQRFQTLEEQFKVTDEKFRSIQVQFTERDTRTEQTSRDSKVAVDAALQAAKEAVGEQNKSSALAIAKSEASTTKLLDQLGVLIQSTSAALNEKIDDVKERLTRLEGQGTGQVTAKADHRESNNWTLAIVLGSISFIGLVTNVLFDLLRK